MKPFLPRFVGRSIKFRIWLSGAQQWKAVDADGSRCGHRSMHVEAGVYTLLSTEKAVLSQFTGLLDKNGKEIYEGDIVRYTDYKDREIISPVLYESPYFGTLDINGEPAGPNELYYEQSGAEVIGNIFENPELLTPNAPDMLPERSASSSCSPK